jgi:hypothetical protein
MLHRGFNNLKDFHYCTFLMIEKYPATMIGGQAKDQVPQKVFCAHAARYCIHSGSHCDSFYFSFLFLPQKEKKQKKSHRCIKNPCFLSLLFLLPAQKKEAKKRAFAIRRKFRLRRTTAAVNTNALAFPLRFRHRYFCGSLSQTDCRATFPVVEPVETTITP